MLKTERPFVQISTASRPITLLTLVIGIATLFNTALADVFSDLPDKDKAYVVRMCQAVPFQSNAAAYRECVTREATSRSGQAALLTNALSFDEHYAVQQYCNSTAKPGSTQYQECTAQQVIALDSVPIPALDSLSADESYIVQQECFSTQTRNGALAYRQCINSALSRLDTIAKPDLSTLSFLDLNAAQLRCSAENNDAGEYRSCLLDSVGGATLISSRISTRPTVTDQTTVATAAPVDSLLTSDPVSPTTLVDPVTEQTADSSFTLPITDEAEPSVADRQTALNSANPKPTQLPVPEIAVEPNIADQPTLLVASETAPDATEIVEKPPAFATISSNSDVETTLNTPTNAGQTNADSENTSPFDRVLHIANQLLTKLQSTFNGFTSFQQLILLAAIALPLLLIAFWILLRQREPKLAYEPMTRSSAMVDRIRPVPQQRRGPETETYAPQQPTARWDEDEQKREIFTDNISHQQRAARHSFTDIDDASPASTSDQSGFLAWLEHHDELLQLPLAIEFMIYWMAFADERYEPELKKTIFTLRNPDDHERIKRWVLKQDTQAFAQTTHWLQTNTTAIQREQILKLLMALLINENAMTPAQNTQLRFLGDVFGFGHERLDEFFHEGFGHFMPPLPRADKPKWWDKQSSDELKRWDARSVSKQNLQIRSRVKLGLPLSGSLQQQDIMAHYSRAEARCHPSQFNELTKREQMLAERELTKFMAARDTFKGISA